MRFAAQCTICGHTWSWFCLTEEQARERLLRTTVCPGLRCHPFRISALDDCILEPVEEQEVHSPRES